MSVLVGRGRTERRRHRAEDCDCEGLIGRFPAGDVERLRRRPRAEHAVLRVGKDQRR